MHDCFQPRSASLHHLHVALDGSQIEQRAGILELRSVVRIGALLEPPLDGREVLLLLVHDLTEGPRLHRLGLRLRLGLLRQLRLALRLDICRARLGTRSAGDGCRGGCVERHAVAVGARGGSDGSEPRRR